MDFGCKHGKLSGCRECYRERPITELEELLLDGLYTDGGHHKQYSLEQAILKLTRYETVEEFIRDKKGQKFIETYGLPEEGIP